MNKTVLVIAAHPDDEVLGCAGTMAKYIALGYQVHVLFMTDGVGSRNESDRDVVQRQLAAKEVAKVLGLSSIKNLNYLDNEMDIISLLTIVQSIDAIISNIQPEIIYTHHIGDLNIDHQVTHKAVMTACRPQPNFCVKEIYAFEVLSSTEWQTPNFMPFLPNVFIDISDYITIKEELLVIYSKEMRDAPHTRSIVNMLNLNNVRGNAVGVSFSEAFMLIRFLK